MSDKIIRIGGASGYWGEAAFPTEQLLNAGPIDYLIYDYLAEITMAIMARARAADPGKGYAEDFLTRAMFPNLARIAEKQVKILSNAGGINPRVCAERLRAEIARQGLSLRVAVVEGDDLIGAPATAHAQQGLRDMFSGAAFPPVEQMLSANAYLGAWPIANALRAGADIVVTGRCVDSALALAAAIASFGWTDQDFDRMAQASLAGHLIECGPQATGGNFTDWRDAGDIAGIGYPIVEMTEDGHFTIGKPAGTGGVVNRGTVAEQLIYEIGDPQSYLLPDVACDFSQVVIDDHGDGRVSVSGARGRAPGESYKVCATWSDGFKAGMLINFIGIEGRAKAASFAEAVFARARRALAELDLPAFTQEEVEIFGGASAQFDNVDEITVKIAAKHGSGRGAGLLIRELLGAVLATPAGLVVYTAGRAKPTPVIRLFSYLLPKASVPVSVDIDDAQGGVARSAYVPARFEAVDPPVPTGMPAVPRSGEAMIEVPLHRLAFGRSGDKGNWANIGIIARDPAFLPWISESLSCERVRTLFGSFGVGSVERFYLPGPGAINFLLRDVLGGGGIASLRLDAQGKAYAQILLGAMIALPQSLLEQAS
ncbi:acyclic terpene utilization AtuA family protein [Sphingobium estronivorans]|uniref:acyclic terpene utilization AtuA family protein n=1 Tax=Sphingobium estronivorans TaxID=1577690 RepID=UPI001238B3D6|nr:acyclic terpene utilization AtuA family protein [Sphingobium estronivorans]